MLKALRHIIQLAHAANNFQEALNIIAQGVRDALETEACSIFLSDSDQQEYVLVATKGLNPKAVGLARIKFGEGLLSVVVAREEPLNLDDASHHPCFLHLPLIQEEIFKAFLAVPIIHHRHILGVLIVQQSEPRRFGEAEEAALMTMAAQLAGFIAKAETTGELRRLFGADETSENRLLTGIAAVPGVGIGCGVVIYPLADLDAVPSLDAEDIDQEIITFECALQAVRDEILLLNQRLAPQLPEEERALFDAYLKMLDPESLGHEVIAEIKAGQWAPGALRKVVKRYVARFEAMDNEYMRERASDVLDMGRRVLSYLQRAEQKTLCYPPHTILMGEAITAANLAEVPEGRLAGIVSSSGSRSSHIAILAKALNIPTVMGVMQLSFAELDGAEMIVDGFYGQVFVTPSAILKQEYVRLAQEERQLNQALERLLLLPAETPDGRHMALHVNAGLSADVDLSLSTGAEGVGLYRTEMPFLIRDRFPSSEEQRVVYRQLLSAFAPRPVVMRVLDVGGDKALPYFPVQEDNPFLGWRGIRILIDHPDIFLSQLRAMLRASEYLDNLQIMFPMVSDISELNEGLRLLEKAYRDVLTESKHIIYPKVGVMIEVPSAVYQARRFAEKVDFLSVGSNDLTQYMLAVDRNNSRVANLYDGLHPSVLYALKTIAEETHLAGKRVSICGEMAADPLAVVLLLGMGYDALSMHAGSIPRMKWVVRQCPFARAQQLLAEVLAMDSVSQIRHHLERALEDMGLSGLIRAGRQ